ncbi:hypothetical protein HNS38_18575 [Lentimicrobium sp. L6]|uniref:hypothetical protein n=1 Tax=Lentimicrobium sp. L6 TaxID=2735916 RepID=UPI001555494D|nr:hypothetical protein [Lentimicrobium sp. L6]NPD86775.1 hypothetical protein [Lentimicrobium sp. L6]
MTKTIYSLFLVGLFLTLSLPLHAQVYYSDEKANYEILIDKSVYQVKAQLKENIPGSRRLQMAKSRLRLKAVDLVGNYIIFKNTVINHDNKEELFEAFVDYSQLHFEAQINHFTATAWDNCGASRCIYFQCNKEDFTIEESSYFQVDLNQLLQSNFDRKRSLSAACLLFQEEDNDIEESRDIEGFFLSGRGKLETEYQHLLKLHPYSQLQYSLFESDSILEASTYQAFELPISNCNFERLIKYKILFTCAPYNKKKAAFNELEEALNEMKGLWWEIQSFAIDERNKADFPGFENATSFDVVMAYPAALNIYGLQITSPGEFYQKALVSFAEEDFKKTIEWLQNEINLNGFSSETLNLIGATYRLKDHPEKGLPFLLLAYNMNPETLYLKGNISLCLSILDFPNLDALNAYYLQTPNLDNWSRNQIEK